MLLDWRGLVCSRVRTSLYVFSSVACDRRGVKKHTWSAINIHIFSSVSPEGCIYDWSDGKLLGDILPDFRWIVVSDNNCRLRSRGCVCVIEKTTVSAEVRRHTDVFLDQRYTHAEYLNDSSFCWMLTISSTVWTLCSRSISVQTSARLLPGACSMTIYSAPTLLVESTAEFHARTSGTGMCSMVLN